MLWEEYFCVIDVVVDVVWDLFLVCVYNYVLFVCEIVMCFLLVSDFVVWRDVLSVVV